MALAPYRPTILPQSESRRTRIATISDAAGGPFTLTGFQEIHGTGEAIFEVNFPVQFFELPVVSFGSHLGSLTGAVPNLINGQFPTATAMVASFRTVNDPVSGSVYYTGASIVVVSTGQSDQIITIHYSVSGKAMTYLPTGQNVA